VKRHGFTLVELLVVIAVIAILAAMLAPVIIQAKESARMRVCVSNIRQLGMAIEKYMDDYNGYGLTQNSPLARQTYNPWVLCVEPLMPAYLPGSPAMIASYQKQRLPGGVYPSQPKYIWVCSGDLFRGSNQPPDQPYWWNCGSSYMYPGPKAYIHTDGDNMYDRVNLTPLKPLTWLNHKRDVLLMDYWYDFHSGGKRVDHMLTGDVMPEMLAEVQNIKCINALFLDMHVKSLTAGERVQFMGYVMNPPAPKDPNTPPGDNPYAE